MTDARHEWLEEVANGIGDDLFRFLRSRMPNSADAEELAQEVYLRLLRVKEPSRIRNRRAYVLQVAANVACEWRLLARNRLGHSSAEIETLSVASDAEREAVVRQEMDVLEQALGLLSPKCRAVLLMQRRDRFTQQEIAERMGISVSMVKKYLTRGLSVCQQHLMAHREYGQSHD